MFTVQQMNAAYKNVKTGDNVFIDKVIKYPGRKNLDCLREAIRHFTGADPQFTWRPDGHIHVATNSFSPRNS